MPILILLVLIVLVAQLGFWDTLQAILGGVLMIVLLIACLAALAGFGARYFYRRFIGRP